MISELEKMGGIRRIDKIVFTGKMGHFDCKAEEYSATKNEKLYVLAFVAGTAQFDNYKNVAEEIMNSFEIK